MEQLDNDNYNELYRLHTGHALFGSDSDSLDEPVLTDSKPPLYSFDELNANLVVIEAISNQKKNNLNKNHTGGSSGLNTDQIIQKELEKLIFPDCCLLCSVHKCSIHDIENHKRGKTHRENIEQYIKGRLEALQNKMYAENTYCNRNIQNKQSPTKQVEETLQQKIEDLLLPHYCYVCYADLSTPHNAYSHYNSSRHKNNVRCWKEKNTSRTENILQQKLASLIKLDYCHICDANLTGPPQAQSHYESNRHKNKVEIWLNEHKSIQLKNKNGDEILSTNQNITKTSAVQKSEPISSDMCKVCGIMVEADIEKHILLDEHIRNVEMFCFVCNIKTMSKEQLAEHIRGQRHKNNMSMQNSSSSSLDIPRKVITPVKKEDKASINVSKPNLTRSTLSSVSKEILRNTDVVKEHATGVVYEKNIQQPQLTVTTSPWLLSAAEEHLKDIYDILKIKKNYCNICNMTFGSKDAVDNHTKTFPHQEILKLKSTLVSKGISTQEFWICDAKTLHTIYCSLCNVSIQSSPSAVGHFESKSHSGKFNRWCSEQFKNNKNPYSRWYFCEICNQHLDGTTNVEFHYRGQKHAKQYTTQLDVQTATTSNTMDIIKKDTLKVENSQLGFIEKGSIDKETAAQTQTINSTDKTENINSTQDIPNNTYKETKSAETTLDKNRGSKISQEFKSSGASTSKEIFSYISSKDNNVNRNTDYIENETVASVQELPINSAHKNEKINGTQNVADKVDIEIKTVKKVIEENKANKVSREDNKSNSSTKTVNVTYSKKFLTKNSKYCQTEQMEEINNKYNLKGLEMEMEKFTCALNSVPLSLAQRYLQNCTKKLEESMKNERVLDIEVENSIENDVCVTKKSKRKKKKKNTWVSEVTIDQSEYLSNAPKSKTNNGLSNLLFWSAVGILFFWSLKR